MAVVTSIYVDRFYCANAEFEDVVFGDALRDGMFVLMEDEMFRGDIERAQTNAWEKARLDEYNRWCEVSQLRLIPRPEYSDALVQFVALYPNGDMKVRKCCASYAWIVKKDLS